MTQALHPCRKSSHTSVMFKVKWGASVSLSQIQDRAPGLSLWISKRWAFLVTLSLLGKAKLKGCSSHLQPRQPLTTLKS